MRVTPKEVEDYISSFTDYVHSYRENANQQGIFLFISTLGCWGPSNVILQYFAFFLVGIIYFKNAFKEWDSEGKHITHYKGLELINDKISKLKSKRDQRYYYSKVKQYKNENLSFLSEIKGIYIAVLTFLFYVANITYFMQDSKGQLFSAFEYIYALQIV